MHINLLKVGPVQDFSDVSFMLDVGTQLAQALRNTCLYPRRCWYPALPMPSPRLLHDFQAALVLAVSMRLHSATGSSSLSAHQWKNDIMGGLACKHVAAMDRLLGIDGVTTCWAWQATGRLPCQNWRNLSAPPRKTCHSRCWQPSQACMLKPPALHRTGGGHRRNASLCLMMGILPVQDHHRPSNTQHASWQPHAWDQRYCWWQQSLLVRPPRTSCHAIRGRLHACQCQKWLQWAQLHGNALDCPPRLA